MYCLLTETYPRWEHLASPSTDGKPGQTTPPLLVMIDANHHELNYSKVVLHRFMQNQLHLADKAVDESPKMQMPTLGSSTEAGRTGEIYVGFKDRKSVLLRKRLVRMLSLNSTNCGRLPALRELDHGTCIVDQEQFTPLVTLRQIMPRNRLPDSVIPPSSHRRRR